MLNSKNKTYKLVLSAMFIAIAFVLPFFTGQIPEIGKMLLPMHIPAILCGFICGWPWGLAVGFVSPVLRSLIMTRPNMFPEAIGMAFEIATYGAIAGLMFKLLPKKKAYIYVSLLTAMLAGRIVWGFARLMFVGFDLNAFGFATFWAGAIAEAIPGIIIQIVLVPFIIMLLDKYKHILFTKK